VAFSLRHDPDSAEAASFLDALRALATIDGVRDLQVVRQVSPKNGCHFGASMEFANQAAFDAYNSHPDHVAFVEDRWTPEVTEVVDMDFAPLA
jgi:hypothetical protein